MPADDLYNLSGGITLGVQPRQLGLQSYGISMGGANDQLSYTSAHILLGSPDKFQCLEIIHPPKQIIFTQEVIFIITGSPFPLNCLNTRKQVLKLEHAVIYHAKAGDSLSLNGLRSGLRSYLMVTALNNTTRERIGLKRGAFGDWFMPYTNQINVIAGPEYSYLIDESEFLLSSWEVALASNAMGIRLSGRSVELSKYDIISSPVADGTIQMTSNGPIVLMRHRQTIGGYPRVFQVSEVSINHLAQIPFKRIIRFNKISRNEAINELKQQELALTHFRNKFSN